MAMTSLPVIDRARTRFGHQRTKCGCETCSVSCRYVPGMLVPEDLWEMAVAGGVPADGGPGGGSLDGEALLAWARLHLRASPGALVAGRDHETGQLARWRIPTLVPARKEGTPACHWLGDDGTCAVHAVSPYGCAFMDSHLPEEEGRRRSEHGLMAIEADLRAGGPYSAVWRALEAEGLVAPGPEESRERMRQETGTVYAPQAADNPDRRPVAERDAERRAQMRELVRRLAVQGERDPVPDGDGGPAMGCDPVRNKGPRVGRNDPCPCGKGQKFKKCCGR
jgi:hypothetical protein